MPSPRPSRSASSRQTCATRAGSSSRRRGQRPASVARRLPVSRVRWDRKLRLTMLAVLALVGWVGLHGLQSLLRARAQSSRELSLVSTLTQENRALAHQAQALQQPETIIRDARALGMVRRGERAYVVTGLRH